MEGGGGGDVGHDSSRGENSKILAKLIHGIPQSLKDNDWKLHLKLQSLSPECSSVHHTLKYRGADESLSRPGRKQANVSVRME